MSKPTEPAMQQKQREGFHVPIGSIVIGLAFAGIMLLTWLLVKPPAPPAELQGVLRSDFRPVSSFLLSSASHGPITEKELRERWTFVFFGYMSCPDVCPNTLYELKRFWNRVHDSDRSDSPPVQVLFVSVDPDRDSTENLAAYVAHFNREFIGATAGTGQIESFTRQFGAGYMYEAETESGQYLVAHTSAIFLVDPYGRLVANFSQPHYADTLAAQFERIEKYFDISG